MEMISQIVKINNSLKRNIVKILSYIIVGQPIIDLIIGISLRSSLIPPLFSVIRLSILIFLFYYFFFISRSKHKPKIIISIALVFAYLLLFYINSHFALTELKIVVRVFYFPLLFIIICSILNERYSHIDDKYFLISLFIYAFIIIFGAITKTAYNSYLYAKVGTTGYFNAANEVGNIFAILLPVVFNNVFNKINIKKILYFIVIVSAIIILGTKTPFVSLIICSIYYFLIKIISKKNIIPMTTIFLIITALSIMVIVKTPFYQNIKTHARFLKINSIVDIIENPKLFDHLILGSRFHLLSNNQEIYKNSDLSDKILGIGYTRHTKLAEMEMHDIFYRHGIVGFIIYMIVIINAIVLYIKKIDHNYTLSIILIISIAVLVGHVFTAPAVSTFVAFLLCLSISKGVKE